MNFSISNSKFILYLAYTLFLALMSFDLRTYLVTGRAISLLTSVLIFIYLCGYFVLIRRYKFVRLRGLDILIIAFFFLYTSRVYYDLYIQEIHHTIFQNKITYFVYILFLSILPYCVCRIIPFSKFRMDKLLCLLSFFYLIALLFSFSEVLHSIAMKTYYGNDGRFSANEMLDTIGYGHIAATLTLMSISLLYYSSSRSVRFYSVLGLIVGVFSIIIANSRSPMLALLFCLFLIYIKKINLKVLVAFSFCLFLFVFNIESIDQFFQETFKSAFVERFVSIFSGDMNALSGRDTYYNQGIQMFFDSPILGSSFLLKSGDMSGDYVHNFFLESLMFGGLIGGIIYIVIMIISFRYAYHLIKERNEYMFFGLFFMQMFIYSMFSRSFIALPLYWVSISSLYTISICKGKR